MKFRKDFIIFAFVSISFVFFCVFVNSKIVMTGNAVSEEDNTLWSKVVNFFSVDNSESSSSEVSSSPPENCTGEPIITQTCIPPCTESD